MNWHYDKNGEANVLSLARYLVETPELTGFEVKQDVDQDGKTGLIHLIKGDLDIFITEGAWNTKPGKLTFIGAQPNDPHRDVYDFHGGSINVSMSRGPAAIARDIERRLIPEYTQAVNQALEKIKRESERRALRDRVCKNLATRLPQGKAVDINTSGSRAEVRFDDGRGFGAAGYIRGDVHVYLDGSAEFKIRSGNNAFLFELAELINKHAVS